MSDEHEIITYDPNHEYIRKHIRLKKAIETKQIDAAVAYAIDMIHEYMQEKLANPDMIKGRGTLPIHLKRLDKLLTPEQRQHLFLQIPLSLRLALKLQPAPTISTGMTEDEFADWAVGRRILNGQYNNEEYDEDVPDEDRAWYLQFIEWSDSTDDQGDRRFHCKTFMRDGAQNYGQAYFFGVTSVYAAKYNMRHYHDKDFDPYHFDYRIITEPHDKENNHGET